MAQNVSLHITVPHSANLLFIKSHITRRYYKGQYNTSQLPLLVMKNNYM